MLLSFQGYLHERAAESRHSERIGYFISTIGAIFFVGGILETAITVTNPNWFLVFPISMDLSHPYSILGFVLTVIGVGLLLAGIVFAVFYASQRGWFLDQLKKTFEAEEITLRSTTLAQVPKRKR